MIERVEPFKNRLEKALAVRDIRPVDLAKRTGLSQSTISQYRSGYAEPKSDKLAAISQALAVNPAWLMGLDVAMEIRHATNAAEQLGRVAAHELADARSASAMSRFLELSDEDRDVIISMIDRLHSIK